MLTPLAMYRCAIHAKRVTIMPKVRSTYLTVMFSFLNVFLSYQLTIQTVLNFSLFCRTSSSPAASVVSVLKSSDSMILKAKKA